MDVPRRLHRGTGDGPGRRLDDGDPSTARSTDEVGSRILAEANATGAVLTGRRTFDHADRWNGDHHDGVPIFVLTRSVPEQPAPGHAHYVTDVPEAAEQARQAAGDRDVMLHGASAARALLDAGELDETSLQIMPVLLGQGRRLFDDLSTEHVELELTRTLDSPAMLHTRYRIGPAERHRNHA
ncbi:dihydrofolate reductase family protein [Prauserella halophila]|uniref:Dihydrofolate reductase family protein n=1 Tax=Prauserella halophila TaxID=185641 RepID=A0ABN1WCP1_9PSEU|nr:dihydrofolate reductase family protein [Prauserella halophila]MCP2237069.1 Dihydrofolate reductase [Prauserella halophila]